MEKPWKLDIEHLMIFRVSTTFFRLNDICRRSLHGMYVDGKKADKLLPHTQTALQTVTVPKFKEVCWLFRNALSDSLDQTMTSSQQGMQCPDGWCWSDGGMVTEEAILLSTW